MKNLIIISICSLLGCVSCKNAEIEHPDFDYTSGFFPYQFPVRTLILGDDIYDNANDNAHKFVISVAMGGVYKNEKDRKFSVQVDESLCNNILFGAGGEAIKALPASYYQLSSNSEIVIPKGEMNGGIEVQLTDAFFNDAMAIKLGYVVPIRLTGSNDVDSILNGSSANPNADVRFAGQWSVAPKNFTMFAVKYINEFHGTYFHYGKSSVKDASGAEVESKTYSTPYVENNSTSKLVTTGRYQVSLSTNFQSEIMTGSLDMRLTFNGKDCSISAPEGSPYTITGTGEFQEGAYNWGNKLRNGIVMNYQVSDGTHTYAASDVLVARDRGVVLEVYNPQIP